MPDTFGDLRDSLDELAGLDLTDAQRDALLNEGHRELATRSEWYRAEIELGPTVADQEDYALPADLHRILNLSVAGLRFEPSDRLTVDRLRDSTLYLNPMLDGVWWLSWSAANARQVSLYPAPAGGLEISALVIERPALMSADADEPVVPSEYRQAIADYASGQAFAAQEDNLDARAFYQEAFDRAVADLRRLTFSGGRVPTFWGQM